MNTFMISENVISLQFEYSTRFTMWKFQELFVNQILREINFGEIRSSKTAVFAILEALNCVNFVCFSIQKV